MFSVPKPTLREPKLSHLTQEGRRQTEAAVYNSNCAVTTVLCEVLLASSGALRGSLNPRAWELRTSTLSLSLPPPHPPLHASPPHGAAQRALNSIWLPSAPLPLTPRPRHCSLHTKPPPHSSPPRASSWGPVNHTLYLRSSGWPSTEHGWAG